MDYNLVNYIFKSKNNFQSVNIYRINNGMSTRLGPKQMIKVNNMLFFSYPTSGNWIVYYLRRCEDHLFYLSLDTEAHISATIKVIIFIPC